MTLSVAEVFLVASGDLRLAANQQGWSVQVETEAKLSRAFANEGVELTRAHLFDEQERMGMNVFKTIDKDVPVAEAVWQYSHHVLAELLLGTDVGTYSSKGVLTEPDGTVLKTQVVEHAMDIPQPGWAEQDADGVWWHDVQLICRFKANFNHLLRGAVAYSRTPGL